MFAEMVDPATLSGSGRHDLSQVVGFGPLDAAGKPVARRSSGFLSLGPQNWF